MNAATRGVGTACCLAALAFGTADALAEAAHAPEDTTRQTVRFGGRPRAECAGFVLLELGVFAQAKGNEHSDDAGHFALNWRGGYLHNTGEHTALGASIQWMLDGDGHRTAFVARYRRWLSSEVGLDFSPGVYFARGGELTWHRQKLPGATVELGLGVEDRIGLQLGADILRGRRDQTVVRHRLGVRLGGWIAPATAAIVMAGRGTD